MNRLILLLVLLCGGCVSTEPKLTVRQRQKQIQQDIKAGKRQAGIGGWYIVESGKETK
ncbi:MAG: hypothetical protein JXA69_14655 [Phycisphaerae bacterium]|nr:hypothetical protein [Phycisphaerae bacterium]